MQSMFDSLERIDRPEYLIDTCFFIHTFEHGNVKSLEKLCSEHSVAMCSFNIEEFLHIHHKLKGDTNHHIRSFLKKGLLKRVDVPVSPGDHDSERRYVTSFDDKVLIHVPDPSDAVLYVLAQKIGADVLTKDKHHLFTAAAENNTESIAVLKEFPIE